MTVKLLSWMVYALKWLGWLLKYGVVWPAACLMLLMIMLFRLQGTTPGDVMAKEIARATASVGSGEYRVSACLDKESGIKQADRRLNAAPVRPVCRELGSIITDAKGYAASINGSLRGVFWLWTAIASVFALLSLSIGVRPYYLQYGHTRSALFRYGTQAIITGGQKQEVNRE